MATKLWDKGFEPDKMIEEYTVGDDRELDMRLARYDVQGSLAHIAMLETIGLLTAGELEKLTAGLKEIAAEIEAGRFVPSTVLALKIARIFGKPVEQVFQLEEGD